VLLSDDDDDDDDGHGSSGCTTNRYQCCRNLRPASSACSTTSSFRKTCCRRSTAAVFKPTQQSHVLPRKGSARPLLSGIRPVHQHLPKPRHTVHRRPSISLHPRSLLHPPHQNHRIRTSVRNRETGRIHDDDSRPMARKPSRSRHRQRYSSIQGPHSLAPNLQCIHVFAEHGPAIAVRRRGAHTKSRLRRKDPLVKRIRLSIFEGR
jgi:hypothetical protein